jgi:iron complex transport system substrate-binding protein
MRIASLLPSATEILFAIGAGDRVVATTHECDHPLAAHRLPRVTADALATQGAAAAEIDRHIRRALHDGSSIYTLDAALLDELRPDLIITQELCEVCAVAYRQVQQAVRRLPGEVPVISLEPGSLDDIVATVIAVGRAAGCDQRAGEVAAAMRERIAVVAALAAPQPRPVVVCLEWTDPLMAGGHWVPEMVRVAGGGDPLGRPGVPSRAVDWAEVVAAEPDVIVLMPCGFDLKRTLALSGDVTGMAGFADLACARSGRVLAVDGSSYFNRPGPRIVSGLEILAAALRATPGDPLPAGAAWALMPAAV